MGCHRKRAGGGLLLLSVTVLFVFGPEFYKAQDMRLPTYDKPRVISCAEEFPQFLGLPRGLLDEVSLLLNQHKITPVIQDERFQGKEIDARFAGTIRDGQPGAVSKILKHDEGVLCAGMAFGKTVAAAYLIAARRTNTLIIVHRAQLLDQWREKLAVFLDLPIDQIGQIGAGKAKATGIIDVASMQSLHRQGRQRIVVGRRVQERQENLIGAEVVQIPQGCCNLFSWGRSADKGDCRAWRRAAQSMTLDNGSEFVGRAGSVGDCHRRATLFHSPGPAH